MIGMISCSASLTLLYLISLFKDMRPSVNAFPGNCKQTVGYKELLWKTSNKVNRPAVTAKAMLLALWSFAEKLMCTFIMGIYSTVFLHSTNTLDVTRHSIYPLFFMSYLSVRLVVEVEYLGIFWVSIFPSAEEGRHFLTSGMSCGLLCGSQWRLLCSTSEVGSQVGRPTLVQAGVTLPGALVLHLLQVGGFLATKNMVTKRAIALHAVIVKSIFLCSH